MFSRAGGLQKFDGYLLSNEPSGLQENRIASVRRDFLDGTSTTDEWIANCNESFPQVLSPSGTNAVLDGAPSPDNRFLFELWHAVCRNEFLRADAIGTEETEESGNGSPPTNGKAKLVGVMVVKGRCAVLEIPRHLGAAHGCDGKLLHTLYDNGRAGYYFVGSSDGAAVTFTGLGSQQVKVDADRSIQPVDGIILTLPGKTETLRAVGECRIANPYGGPVPIGCRATTGVGEFVGEFFTDGAPPEVDRF